MNVRRWTGFLRREALVACLAVLAMAACQSAPSEGVSTEDFAEEYKQATEEYQAAVDAVQEKGASVAQTDPKQVAAVFEELQAVADQTHDRYAELTPPADLKEPFGSLVENLRRQSEALDRIAASTQEGAPDGEALRDLAGLLSEFAATQQLLAQRLAENG